MCVCMCVCVLVAVTESRVSSMIGKCSIYRYTEKKRDIDHTVVRILKSKKSKKKFIGYAIYLPGCQKSYMSEPFNKSEHHQ